MNDAALQTTPAVRAYLRRATWGLPKERQQEVWDELEEHLLSRAAQLQVSGLIPSEALKCALAELGSPARVSAGMTGVYLMPKLILIAGASAVALSAALYALAGGNEGKILTLPALSTRPVKPSCARGTVSPNAMIEIVSQKDGVTCYTFTDPSVYAGAFVGLNDLKNAFEANGIKTKFLPNGALEVHYPNAPRRLLNRRFEQGGQGFVDAASLIVSTVREPITPRLELTGFDNPVLTLGTLRLQLGSQEQPVKGAAFYQSLMPTLVGVLTTPDLSKGWEASVGGIDRNTAAAIRFPKHQIQTDLNGGEIVMLLTARNKGLYFADFAPVSSDGRATLYTDQSRLRFVSDVAQLSPHLSGGRIPALLVRVTDVPLRSLKIGIFIPRQATSDAQTAQ